MHRRSPSGSGDQHRPDTVREGHGCWWCGPRSISGLRAFLSIVQEPVYQRVVLQDGPAILGDERFREQEERSSYGIGQDVVVSVLEASTYGLDHAMKRTFSRIFFSAMSAAGESVTTSEDPRQAVGRIEAAILFALEGMKSLAEKGVMLTDPAAEGA